MLNIAAILLTLLAAEGAVRLLAAGGMLPSPDPLLWHRKEVSVKLDQIQALAADGHIDVLFVGSSVAYTGLNPIVFDQTTAALTGEQFLSYNAGLAALPVSMVDRFAEQVFAPAVSPQTIILLLSPRDLNQNNPINQGIVAEIMASANGQALLEPGWKAALPHFLLGHSQLFRYRNTIMVTILNGLRFPAQLPAAYDDPVFDARGYAASPANLAERLAAAAGSVPEFEMAALSLQNYDPTGEHAQGLENLAQFCEQHGIQLIIVNMPMTSYVATGFASPALDYQRYLETVARVTTTYHIPLWDLNAGPWRDQFSDADFSDIFHLNTAGANKVAHIVAELYAATATQESQRPVHP